MSSAYKEVQEKNDGNLANNAPPYDKVTRRDVITGRLGKDEMGGKRKKHDCAKKVNYKNEEFDVIPEQHTMLEDGTVTHYDITNDEYIYENVPVEDLEILISEKHEHFDNYDKNAEVLGEGYKEIDQKKKNAMFRRAGNLSRDAISTPIPPEKRQDAHKKSGKIVKQLNKLNQEAFLFSDEEVEQLHIIDECTDEELIDFMIEAIQELAVDQEDLIEICEALEGVEVLTERMDPKEVQRRRDQAKDRLATGAAMKKAAEKSSGPSRMDRLKSAAKKAGSMVKAGVKTAGKKAVQTAGKVAGEFSAAKEKQKKAAMARPEKKETSSSSSSDDDGTGGKLDKLLADTRGKSSSSSSDSGSSSSGGGGSSSSSSGSSSSGSTRRAVGGALRKVGGLLKKGLKKAVGKTARVVSSGSDKLAKKLGEQYDEIADMYESGLFTIEEIENVVELYKGKHGQTDKQYADSRSPGGKMVSGDSKGSGAEYTHGRRVKAANPGMQPDVGGKTKPKSQGRMDKGTRADLEYRKANLKKKD
jgi:hypothetical protein